DFGIDRIDRDHGGQDVFRARAWLNEIADSDALVTDPPIDRRLDLRKLKVQRGGILCCFSRTRRRESTPISSSLLVELARRNGILAAQIRCAIQLNLRKF